MRCAEQIDPNFLILGSNLEVINQTTPLKMKFFGIVSPDGATVYVRNELGGVVSFGPLFKILDSEFDEIVQFEIAGIAVVTLGSFQGLEKDLAQGWLW